ncbi:MAG: phytanoyl-CoA dioxygenase family protein [Pseudomonadota bacterium]
MADKFRVTDENQADPFDMDREPFASGPYLEERHRQRKLYPDLRRLGLQTHIADLAMQGYTVLPPHMMVDAPYLEQLRAAVLRVATERSGVTPDLSTGATHANGGHPLGQFMRYILFEDEVFEPLLTHPRLLGLVNYLIGERCILSLYDAMLKGPGKMALPVHNDHGDKHTATYPALSNGVTVNFTLSDYDEGAGPVAFLPGSHNFKREPLPAELKSLASEMVPITAPAGSAIIWSADTWHMAMPRRDPGLRMTLLLHFCRSHLQPQANFRGVAPHILERNPPRFTQLMDVHGVFPFGVEDIDRQKAGRAGRKYSVFDGHSHWQTQFSALAEHDE